MKKEKIMKPASLRWIALTSLGLASGVGIALALEDPIDALVGMVLLTPVLTLMAGGILGAVQWIELRSRLHSARRWLLGTMVGLGVGLAVGIVAIEVVGQLLLGHPLRLLRMAPAERALSFLILGIISGACLGLAQQLLLRKESSLPKNWFLLSAAGLGLGFPAGSLLADLLVENFASAAGLLILVLVSGAVLGGFTARPVARTA
jgi:hypothetical protein